MFERNEMEETPIVKAVQARGGIVRQGVSGKTDYLVAESIQTVNENQMRDAAAQIEKGKGLQVISADQLIRALKET